MYEYDDDFYRYINQGSTDSAGVVIPALLGLLPGSIGSVLDVGCGAGAWLSVWKRFGARVAGVDGDYVNRQALLIEDEEFFPADLAEGFTLNEKFDLVQSLEVAEHLPSRSATGFVESLCRHADIVMFSAAPPGQGGENHVNEQPYDYWRKQFQRQGFDMYDPLRLAVRGKMEVKPWYRYNTFVYVRRISPPELRSSLERFRIRDDQHIRDMSPPLYRIRKRIVRMLPVSAGTLLATLKKQLYGLSFTRNGG